MAQMIRLPLKDTLLTGARRWLGPRPPRMPCGGQELKREIRPRKIRWGWVLPLVIFVVLAMGECGPAASAIAALP